jgi:hypothetical protein
VDVVGDDGLFEPAEIANARATGKKQKSKNSSGRLGVATVGSRRHRRYRRSAASQPSTTAILRRWRRVRFGILDERRVVPFDADDRENDDGSGLFRHVRAAEAHDASFVRKLDNATHGGGPAIVRSLPAADP